MSEIEEQKLEAGLEQIVRHFMKDQLSNVTDFRKEGDNSFAFLEKVRCIYCFPIYYLATREHQKRI